MDIDALTDDDRKQLAKDLAAELDTGLYGNRAVLSRRQLLTLAGGSAGVSGLVALGVDPATAQSAAGQVGTEASPEDVFAYDLDVQNGAEFNGNDLTGVGSLSTDELSTTETSDPNNPNIWYGSGAIERRETNAVPVTADNTAQDILDVNEGALVLVYAYPDGSVLDGFTDVVHRLGTNATVINGEGTQTRGYSVLAGSLKLSIDDNSESYVVDAVSIGAE